MKIAHRGFTRHFTCLIPLALASLAVAQPLSLGIALERGLSVSPAVRAAEQRLAAARAEVERAKASLPPILELAPGLGFTNSNFALSQRIDVAGVRGAETLRARAELQVAVASAQIVRHEQSLAIASLFLDVQRTQAEERRAAEGVALARALRELVQKRVDLGEAPAIHASRAEIELRRVEQDLVRSSGRAASSLASLRHLLEAPDAEVMPSASPEVVAPSVPEVLRDAVANRPEIQLARARLAEAQAAIAIGRSHRRPSITAGLATDVWSLDRSPFSSNNLGFQLVLTTPLFDRRSRSREDDRLNRLVDAAENEAVAAERTVRSEVIRLAKEVETRRQIAANYRTQILPTAHQLLEATRKGYEAGLVTLVEVLDAQRTARQTEAEYAEALFDARLAEIQLRHAAGTLIPITQEGTN